jgi:CRP-like cAMP-binding protein
MKSELAGASLECRCREEVGAIIDRIVDRTHREKQGAALNHARAMRDRIRAYLTLLAELDDLTAEEQDLTSFDEIASLFEDIGAAAAEGTRAALLAAGDPQGRK